ncbi:MAG TPA: hypothetical protein VF246_06580 [Acidimicrobiia bacterium]|jgi:hypothetical protein
MEQVSLGRILVILGIAFAVMSLFSGGQIDLIFPIILIFVGRIISAVGKQQRKSRAAKPGSTVAIPEPTVTVPEAQTPQTLARRNRAGSLEEKLREILMVPPGTIPTPSRPKPRRQPAAAARPEVRPEPVYQAPAAEPAPRPAPMAESAPRVEPAPMVEPPVLSSGPKKVEPLAHRRTATNPLGTTRRLGQTTVSSASKTGSLSSMAVHRRVRRSPSGARTSSEMVAEAKERLRQLKGR